MVGRSAVGDFLSDQKVTKESLGANLVRLAAKGGGFVSQKFVPRPPVFTGASVKVHTFISGVR